MRGVPMNGKKRVLLIEDDEPTVRFMRLTLKRKGYAVEVASNRQDALISLSTQKPALIIMDYVMTGLSSPDFIKGARGLGFEGPILLCTAMHQDYGLAVEDVLYKPFDPDELLKRLDTLVSSRRAS
jgi:DNA-binding response OmpR family regulator